METLDKIKIKDARSLPAEAQEDLRKKTVRAVLKGMTQINAADLFGITRQAVGKWIKAYREGGVKTLDAKQQGHPPGKVFLPQQKQAIIQTIINKTPDQLGLPYNLWTREAVAELIFQRFGVRRSPGTIGNYLKQWGFTPQKPTRRAYEQDSESVETWLEQEYPEIKKKAQAEGAQIFWCDEMGIRSNYASGTTYGLKGQTPVIPITVDRFGCNQIACISNLGLLFFMLFIGNFCSKIFLEFLQRLLKQYDGKIFLILDRHRAHRSKSIEEWVAKHSNRITLYYLPNCSPELNPTEYLNQDIKSNAVGKKRPRNLFELIRNVIRYLFDRQKKPDIVASYFKAKSVKYALP